MMAHKRFLLLWILLLILGQTASASNQQNEQYREAKQHFDRARELDSLNEARAEQEYRLAIKARGGVYPEALQQLSFYLRRQLRFSEAAKALEDYINQTPQKNHADDIEELRDLKRAANFQHRINDAEQPGLADLIEFASFVGRYAKPKDALPYAEKALSLYPTSSEAHMLLARLLIGARQQERRYELLRKAVELDSNNPKTHNQLGWFYIEAWGSKDAADEFHLALELSKGQLADAWQGLGWALSSQGQNKEAIEAFRNYLRSDDIPKQYRVKINQQIAKLESGSRH